MSVRRDAWGGVAGTIVSSLQKSYQIGIILVPLSREHRQAVLAAVGGKSVALPPELSRAAEQVREIFRK